MMFARPEHIFIAQALDSMDTELLWRCRCYFGGGTAIVLKNGEYRLSQDIDFLCSDADGYREMRTLAVNGGIAAFFGKGAEATRDFKTDQYGLRSVFEWRGQRIKFEIVREARIDISGVVDPDLHVPILSTDDQFAEKLLANADRGLDRSSAYRDAIDLGYLAKRHGGIPSRSVEKAEAAYGSEVSRKIVQVLALLVDPLELGRAADSLQMPSEEAEAATRDLRSAVLDAWPRVQIASIPTPTPPLPPPARS